jgi:phytoene dehydrogenase-like protein
MEYDGIIVGDNGLICASYLAKAGLRIAVAPRTPPI